MKRAFIQLHLAVLLAGFTAILGRLINLSEGMLVWWRLVFSTLALLVYLAYRSTLKWIGWKKFLTVAVAGAVLALHWVAFYGSIKNANVSVALVCFSATGFFTALLEPILTKTSLNFPELLLGILVIIGIYILFDFHPQYGVGIVFGIVAAILAAIFPVMNKILLQTLAPAALTFYEFGGAFLFLSIMLPFYHHYFPAAYFWPRGADWLWLTVFAVCCTILMFYLQLQALRKISAFTVNLTYNLEPVYGILMAVLLFNEQQEFNSRFYICIALILLSIALHMLLIKRKNRQKDY